MASEFCLAKVPMQTKGAYQLMQPCWEIVPENRPAFGNIREDLDHAVHTGDWEGYFD